MNSAEILVLVIFGVIFALILITYLFHGRKLTKKSKQEKADKSKPKAVEEKPVEIKKEEQKPVAVGIIKEEKINTNIEKDETIIEDFAPFKEVKKETNLKEDKKQTIQEEIKNSSPEMKKILMSDILKPKF